jgi:hypothetical protein
MVIHLLSPMFRGAFVLMGDSRTVGITPGKAMKMNFDEVKRVCITSTIAGLNAFVAAGTSKPFRLVYMSGSPCERDQTKKPLFMPKFLLMRVSVPDPRRCRFGSPCLMRPRVRRRTKSSPLRPSMISRQPWRSPAGSSLPKLPGSSRSTPSSSYWGSVVP